MNLARISKSACPVSSEPRHDSESSSEVLFGESVQVLESGGEWCKIQSLHDGYEGYITANALDSTPAKSTHWVCNRATLVFEKADIKSVVVNRLMFGSELSVECTVEDFLQLRTGGYVWSEHCYRKGESLEFGMVEIGHRQYLNSPYRWGGRSTDGCDCSGLVQMLAMARGISLPRDSIDQQMALNNDVEFKNRKSEDLIFWPGHVGILQSSDTVLHATAHSMQCCFEPLQHVIDRAGSPVSIKRIV